MTCIKCGAELPDGANFCHLCGKKQIPAPRKHRKRANSSGSITKLSGNRSKPWQAKKNGIHIGTYQTRMEAQKALERLTDNEISDRFNLTFRQVYDLWLPEHSRTITKGAVTGYKTALKHCESLYDKKFRSLRHSDFQAVIIGMEELGYSKSSCEKVLQLFGQLSDWAIREAIILVNHAKYVTITAQQKSSGQVFTQEDIRLVRQSTNPAASIVLILLATGCRPAELFSAARDNCASAHFIGGSKTTSGKNRIIAVAPLGLAAYQNLLSESAGKRKLIDGYKGNKTYANFAKREFKDLMIEIGRESFTPYDCRHTFITSATRSGMDPQILKRQVGHADLSTTDKYYTHLDSQDILNAVTSLNIESPTVGYMLTTNKNQGQPKQSKKLG